ncbi:MAG: HPt (histidine-containing phosphotransfer) domain-containing protein [Akkermansiaceae bacterium]|jgi:HPt (histidine-containing phosphotransfer) domain-containing protein
MSLIDKDQINSISGGEPGILLPILEDFAASSEMLIAEAIAFTKSSNFTQAASLLHQLKGSSGTLGLSVFCEACGTAEDVCHSGEAVDLIPLKAMMSDSVAEASTFMRPD